MRIIKYISFLVIYLFLNNTLLLAQDIEFNQAQVSDIQGSVTKVVKDYFESLSFIAENSNEEGASDAIRSYRLEILGDFKSNTVDVYNNLNDDGAQIKAIDEYLNSLQSIFSKNAGSVNAYNLRTSTIYQSKKNTYVVIVTATVEVIGMEDNPNKKDELDVYLELRITKDAYTEPVIYNILKSKNYKTDLKPVAIVSSTKTNKFTYTQKQEKTKVKDTYQDVKYNLSYFFGNLSTNTSAVSIQTIRYGVIGADLEYLVGDYIGVFGNIGFFSAGTGIKYHFYPELNSSSIGFEFGYKYQILYKQHSLPRLGVFYEYRSYDGLTLSVALGWYKYKNDEGIKEQDLYLNIGIGIYFINY